MPSSNPRSNKRDPHMSIIDTIIDTITTRSAFTADTTPDIKATHDPGLDTQVIPLMLLTALDYDTRHGFRHHQLLALHTFVIEERLADRGITLNRYDWTPTSTWRGRIPQSEQFYADLYDGFTSVSDTEPPVRTRDTTTFDGDPVRFYTVTGYTDLYIQQYFDHATVAYDVVEDVVRDHVDTFDIPASNAFAALVDTISARNPDTYQ